MSGQSRKLRPKGYEDYSEKSEEGEKGKGLPGRLTAEEIRAVLTGEAQPEKAAAPVPAPPGKATESPTEDHLPVVGHTGELVPKPPPEGQGRRADGPEVETEGGEEPAGGGGTAELVIACAEVVEGPLDLSFRTVETRLVFVDCTFGDEVKLERADLAGLEFYRCELAKGINLDWARVHGDLRLVKLRPPGSGVESAAQVPPPQSGAESAAQVPVSAVGTVVEGAVELTGSSLSDIDEEALVASGRRAAPSAEENATGFDWARLLEVVGLGAALAAWIAVVGGARLWARMTAIDAPALPTLAGLGQGWMVVEGLQTLLLPILLALVVSMLVYFSRWERRPTESAWDDGQKDPPPKPKWWWRFGRMRPLLAMRRFARSTTHPLLVTGLLLLALLVATLLVAHASWQVLASTAVILFFGLWFSVTTPIRTETSWSDTARGLAAILLPLIAAGLVAIIWLPSGSVRASAIGAGAAVVICSAFLALSSFMRSKGGSDDSPRRLAVVALLAATLAVLGVFLSMLATVELLWLLLMAGITVLALWVGLGAVADKPPRAAAIAVFVAIVVWSGALGYVREIGDRTPDLTFAQLELRDGGAVSGYFLGRSSDHVFLAQNPPTSDGEQYTGTERHVLSFAAEDVERIVYGKTLVLPDLSAEEEAAGQSGTPWWDFLPTSEESVTPAGSDGEAPGTQGMAPSPEKEQDDPRSPAESAVDQPTYMPTQLDDFDIQAPVDARDEVVAGIPVRLELLGLSRSGELVQLHARVVNMSEGSHTVASMLSLGDSDDFDTPVLIDGAARRVYEVPRTPAECDCSEDLGMGTVDSFESRRLWAMYVVRADVSNLDVTVPGFGTFHDVAVR